MTVRQKFIIIAVLLPALVLSLSLLSPHWLWLFAFIGPIILLGTYDILQTQRSILRLYPVLGRFRYVLESVRSEIQQYFVETDINGTPIPREFRSLIYQRAKGDRDTRPVRWQAG